jgi:hypothetical protein
MKKAVLILTMTIAMMAQDSIAQCNEKTIKNEAKISLNDYTFESMAFKPYSEFDNKKVIKADFSAFNGEKYRMVNISQNFLKPIIINIYDVDNKLILTNKYDNSIDTFDFTTNKSGDYVVEFIISPEDTKNVKDKCVAFVLGYK